MLIGSFRRSLLLVNWIVVGLLRSCPFWTAPHLFLIFPPFSPLSGLQFHFILVYYGAWTFYLPY